MWMECPVVKVPLTVVRTIFNEKLFFTNKLEEILTEFTSKASEL